jgi:hypothetical protein
VNELENYLMDKTAEVAGTHLMPSSAPTYSDQNRSPTKTIKKASLGQRVDVTGAEASGGGATKQAHHYALPGLSRYPLDSQLHVKQASAYFEENHKSMAPVHRHEYCVNLVKRASALGMNVSDLARKYGSESYASDAEIEIALLGRASVIKEAMHRRALNALDDHRALMKPSDFVVALEQFDKVAGISHLYDSHVLDPYLSTFGTKMASDSAIQVDNEYIPRADLEAFARTDASRLTDSFGEDFVKEFRKDPVGILNSLPKDQKKMVIRLASSTLTDPTST